jgi:hypothetical protein
MSDWIYIHRNSNAMTNLVFWICALVHHDAWDCVPARADAGLILSAPEPEKLPVSADGHI